MPLIDPETTQKGEPVWQLAFLFPPQGSWTASDYLTLDAGRLVEFDQGCVEVLDTPTVCNKALLCICVGRKRTADSRFVALLSRLL